MNKIIKQIFPIVVKMPFKLARNIFGVKSTVNWQKEKSDILERAEWLCNQTITSPNELINKMPSMLGEHFQSEWAIYTCSHLAAALANIIRLYPEQKTKSLERIQQLIDLVQTPEMRNYDTKSWGEDALKTLRGNNSHMTYLSILAWMITNYKMAGGSNQYDQLLDRICEALNRRMLLQKDYNLPSFSDGTVYLPDMMFCIVALSNYATLNNGKYADTVRKWFISTKSNLVDPKTGLLISIVGNRGIRGSYSALNCYCLTLLNDKVFSQHQYTVMKKQLKKSFPSWGIKEYADNSPFMAFDPDAGPIVFGLSPSGTAWAIGSATYYKDWKFRNQLLRTAENAGDTVRRNGQKHYRLSEFAMVGESVVLAMKTNISNNQ